MIGIEDKVWVRVNGFDPVYAIADEDLDRENEKRQLPSIFCDSNWRLEMIKALRQGASLSMGIDHPAYKVLWQEVDAAARML